MIYSPEATADSIERKTTVRAVCTPHPHLTNQPSVHSSSKQSRETGCLKQKTSRRVELRKFEPQIRKVTIPHAHQAEAATSCVCKWTSVDDEKLVQVPIIARSIDGSDLFHKGSTNITAVDTIPNHCYQEHIP